MVSANLINEINEECRQNVMIQQKIMRHLPYKLDGNQNIKFGSNYSYSHYDCSELVLQDQRLQHFGFVLKFIK